MAVKITMIRTSNRVFSIYTEADDTNIKEIIYKRQGNFYNSGFQSGVPGYVIKLNNDDDQVILVPEHAVIEVHVRKYTEKKTKIPDLPDAKVTDLPDPEMDFLQPDPPDPDLPDYETKADGL